MNYNPSFPLFRSILSDNDKKELEALSNQYSLEEFQKSNRTYEEMTIDFIYTSAKIEGNTYDRLDTDNLLRLGITAGGKKYTDATMLINLREAFNEVMNIQSNKPIDFDYIGDLHQIITKDLLPLHEQGIVRTSGVQIGGSVYTPPDDPNLLRTELKFILEEANKYQNPFEQAIYLHCNLAYLQYFRDGNKRTARMVQTAALVKNNIFPLFFDENLIYQYQKAVVHYYETGNYDQYISFFKENYKNNRNRLLGIDKIKVLSEEEKERVNKISLLEAGSTPEGIFKEIVSSALKNTTAEQINWYEVERKIAVKLMMEFNLPIDNIIQVINTYSPTCITPEQREIFAHDLKRISSNLAKNKRN